MADAAAAANFHAALQLLSHVYFSPIIGAMVRGGVPDHLSGGPLHADELAQRSALDTLSLTRALRALTAFGAFQEVSPGVFANNGVSDLYCNRPGGLRNCALMYSSQHFLKSASALGHTMLTGQSATQHVWGKPVWDHYRESPEDNEAFHHALAELRGDEHQQIADAYDWTRVNTVVDDGGGVGSLLVAILQQWPSLRGVLVEQPDVLSHAEPVLTARGVRDRCDLISASFFESIPAVGDVWTMCQVLHDWPDADCLRILQGCRQSMRSTDRLLICEMVPVPCRPNIPVSLVDMAMLMYFGEARQRTVEEYKTLFEATHFELARVLPTAGAFSIVEAKPS